MRDLKQELNTIGKYLVRICETGMVYEVRALDHFRYAGATNRNAKSSFWFKATKDDENGYLTAAKHIQDLNKLDPAGIYITINPCNPEFLAIAAKPAPAIKTTKDDDILHRYRLVIDIDAPNKITKTMANEAQCSVAEETTDKVKEYLRGLGWGEPLVIFSGNGRGLIYSIDIPADDAGDNLISDFYDALNRRFDAVDTKMKNRSRITKISGSRVCKGENVTNEVADRLGIAARPWRYADTIEYNVPAFITNELIEKVIADNTVEVVKTDKHRATGLNNIDALRDYLVNKGLHITSERYHDGRDWLHIDRCPVSGSIADTPTSIGICMSADGQIGYNNFSSNQNIGWVEVRKAIDPEYAQRKESYTKSTPRSVQPRTDLIRLSDVKMTNITWLWQDRIPLSNLTMIFGDGGCGKSQITLYMASVISQGRDWLDDTPATGLPPIHVPV